MLNLALPLLLVAVVVHLLLNAFKPGLKDVPGPLLAKFTSLWRLYHTYNGTMLKTIQEYHSKYGTLVRIGPNIVSVSDARMVEDIYGVKANFPKSSWYSPNEGYVNGNIISTLFGTRDKAIHTSLKKPVAGIYSMSSIASYEPLANQIMLQFLRALDERFISTGKPCDIDQWLQYLAFDVISMITMSRPLGFVDQGKDVDSLLAILETEFFYRMQVGIYPIVDKIWRKNRWIPWLLRRKPFAFTVRSSQILEERIKTNKKRDVEELPEEMGRDFVTRFLEQKEKNPEGVSDRALLTWVNQNLTAGSDTTAVTLRSILYRLMKHPKALATLRAEVDATNSSFPMPYSTAHKLPYLTAVIKESLRIHPISGAILLERIVPETGLKVPESNIVLPGGTTVGCTGWTTGFDKRVFGEDAYAFRPERWMKGEKEDEEAFKQRLSMMSSADLSFGKGSRACIGRHVAELELFKLIPTLVGLLDIELVSPDKEWNVEYMFFSKQSDMDVRIKWRPGVVKEEVLV